MDLDLYASPDGPGDVTGAVITALFRDSFNNFIGTESVALLLSSINLNGNSHTHSASVIPEPSAFLLGGFGLLGLLRRRRN